MDRDKGGTANVADFVGRVLTDNLGNRSADEVSSFRKFGTLGRFGGGGRRKETCDGGGEGVVSMSACKGPCGGARRNEPGIRGRGDGGAFATGCCGLSVVTFTGGGTVFRPVFSFVSPDPAFALCGLDVKLESAPATTSF